MIFVNDSREMVSARLVPLKIHTTLIVDLNLLSFGVQLLIARSMHDAQLDGIPPFWRECAYHSIYVQVLPLNSIELPMSFNLKINDRGETYIVDSWGK